MTHARNYKKSRATKRASTFFVMDKLIRSDKLKFSNPTNIERKKPPTNPAEVKQKHHFDWYKKAVPDDDVAMREVLAQEMFRLDTPEQPKTRLAVEDEKGYDEYYVLSKQIPDGIPLDSINLDDINKRITSGAYTGLGNVLVMALFLNEADLKLGNLFVNTEGKIVKIDGDWCFAKLRLPNKNYDITPTVIQRLPYNTTYDADHWLDLRYKNRHNPNPKTIDMSMQRLPALRAEINQTLLRVILLPDELIKRMIAHYTADDKTTEDLLVFLKDRREQIKQAAMQDPSFCAFLKSREAEATVEASLKNLSTFVMTGKTKLLQANDDKIISDYRATFTALREQLEQKTAPLKTYLTVLHEIVNAKSFWGKSTGGNVIPGGIDAIARLLRDKPLDKMTADDLESLLNKCQETARRCIKKGPYEDAQTIYKILASRTKSAAEKITALNDFLENKVKQSVTTQFRLQH